MKRLLTVFFFLGITFQVASQAFLVVESSRRFKNFKYYTGDDIMLITYSKTGIISGTITGITDSTLVLGDWDEVRLDDICEVYRPMRGLRYFSHAFLIGGVAYFGIDLTNRLINNDSPVVPVETALISGSLITTGLLLKLFKYRKLKIGNWKLSVIDPGKY